MKNGRWIGKSPGWSFYIPSSKRLKNWKVCYAHVFGQFFKRNGSPGKGVTCCTDNIHSLVEFMVQTFLKKLLLFCLCWIMSLYIALSEPFYIVKVFNSNTVFKFCLLSAFLNWICKLYRIVHVQDQTVNSLLSLKIIKKSISKKRNFLNCLKILSFTQTSKTRDSKLKRKLAINNFVVRWAANFWIQNPVFCTATSSFVNIFVIMYVFLKCNDMQVGLLKGQRAHCLLLHLVGRFTTTQIPNTSADKFKDYQ